MLQSDFDPIFNSFDVKISSTGITYHPILKIPLQNKSTAPLIHMETVSPDKMNVLELLGAESHISVNKKVNEQS